MISGHLEGSCIPSCFSSWAADIGVAIGYARQGSIAILDTNLVEHHVKIYHVQGLHKAQLASYSYDEEYLAYGPIRGRAYHCVPYTAIQAGLAPIPTHPPEYIYQRISMVTEAAYLFRRSDDTRPDIVIALVAFLAMYHPYGNPDHLVTLMAQMFWADLVQLELPNPGVPSRMGLVNANTYVTGSSRLHQAVSALVKFEDYVRRLRVTGYL